MNYLDLSEQLRPLIYEAAKFMRTEQANFSTDKVEFKGRNDLVSYVDKSVEEMLVKGCEKLIPGSGFILEEGDDVKTSSDFRWIIDPLDGTTNYIHQLPNWCISLALQHEEKTVLGIVYDVSHDEYFHAVAGHGATRNGTPIQVSNAPYLERSLLATGFPYDTSDRLDDLMSVFKSFKIKALGMRRFGSAAIDLAWVACGRFDGYYEKTLNPWDCAAGALLVQEAGGTVTDFSGADNFVFGRELVSSNSVIHAEMLSVVQEFF